MKVFKSSVLFFISIVLSANAQSFINIAPSDLEVLITDADTATKIHTTYADKVQAITELNKWYELVEKIHRKTSAIIGEQFLAVKQLNDLKMKFKTELTKLKREKNPHSAQLLYSSLGKNPDGILHQALKQAVAVGNEAKKWFNKAHAQLKIERKPKANIKVARR